MKIYNFIPKNSINGILIIISFLFNGCDIQQQQLNGNTMGTYFTIKYIPSANSPDQKNILNDINQLLEVVNDQMSTYRPHSEISLFNNSRKINQPFPVSLAIIKVINEAIRIHTLTGGGLDITLQPLVNLWGFGAEQRMVKIPTKIELMERKSWVGVHHLQVGSNYLIKHIPELSIDLSAIAKGYGVDLVAEYLDAKGIEHYMIDIGGEVRTKGKNVNNQYWKIAIEKPNIDLTQQAMRIITLKNQSVATSGNYRNFFEVKGKRYSHTLDPKTGYPVVHQLASITVIADSCMTADGLSTGLGVLGPEKGIELANQLGIPVLMLVSTNNVLEERYSKAFSAYQQNKN